MKIVSWNCAGKFRSKIAWLVETLSPDIMIIQECENPAVVTSDWQGWDKNMIWKGQNKNKGLCIFAKPHIHIQDLNWPDDNLQLFLPCTVNRKMILLGVWTKQANSPTFEYIGQFWKYLQFHREKLRGQDILICGDFNSNAQWDKWDKWDRWWNHSDVVKELQHLGIESLYHVITGEQQGQEKTPTFYQYRHLDKPYHIDYMFSSQSFQNKIVSFEIKQTAIGNNNSDHFPLVLDIKIE